MTKRRLVSYLVTDAPTAPVNRAREMNIGGTYLSGRKRCQLLVDFVLHEAAKFNSRLYEDTEALVRRNTSNRHSNVFVRFLSAIQQENSRAMHELMRLNLSERWVLFHAISYGVMEKDLWNSVGWNGLSWEKANFAADLMVFETKVGVLHALRATHPPFAQVLKYVRSLVPVKSRDDIIGRYECDGPISRANDPIICRRVTRSRLLVHDGSGRLLRHCYLIAIGERNIDDVFPTWVGTPRECNANDDRVYSSAQQSLFVKRATDAT